MHEEPLKTAQEKLEIIEITISSGFFKKAQVEKILSYKENKEIKISTFDNVTEVIKAETNDDFEFVYIFRYKCALKLHLPEDTEQVLTEIIAEFEAAYNASSELSKDEILSFSKNNVGYNVWPYWREFVSSSCKKMSIPDIRTPFYKNKV